MEQFLYPTLTAFFAALITWFFSRKSTEIDNEIKSADFYRNLLDDATRRLNEAIDTITAQDVKIKSLMAEIESLTVEIRKYKQLNGKSE
ncbi:hypothetical protein [Flavobacterium soyangense]|uniref:Holin n=1 Tax=Flavobacterium soyangense TaxID=2023265 RepID=A0A930UE69_9FLAO|nr:hypothetical protein [Flavobacterium soyangense]MBF2708775.1 hypothetical protein [Flavobacterium soyangense]